MHSEVLIVHPLKHHLMNFVAGARLSGKTVTYVTPFYRKGIGRLIAQVPGRIGSKASGYWNGKLPVSQVLSPFCWQIRKMATFLTHRDITAEFDIWAANKIRQGVWKAQIVVTVQDYLPFTTLAAKEAGCILISDQILNQSDSAMTRIARHCRSNHLPEPIHDETLNKRLAMSADHVTVPSLYTLSGLNGYMSAQAKIHVVPYGVDTQQFLPTVRPSGQIIRIVARANSVRKGGHLLLRAIQTISRDLIFIAEGRLIEWFFLGEFEPALHALSQSVSSNLPSGIRIEARNVAHREVPTLLASASLFVMPALSESMSLAALEAASAGLPLILTEYCGLDEFIDGAHGIQVEDNIDSLASALLNAFRKMDDWATWGRNARILAEAYSWERYESKIGEIVANVN